MTCQIPFRTRIDIRLLHLAVSVPWLFNVPIYLTTDQLKYYFHTVSVITTLQKLLTSIKLRKCKRDVRVSLDIIYVNGQ